MKDPKLAPPNPDFSAGKLDKFGGKKWVSLISFWIPSSSAAKPGCGEKGRSGRSRRGYRPGCGDTLDDHM